MAFARPTNANVGGSATLDVTAATATNYSEITSGAKATGVLNGYTFPAKWVNWTWRLLSLWLRWFDERFADGVTVRDLTVRGVNGAAGTNVVGGNIIVSGGQATGNQYSQASLAAATSGSSGTATRTPENYIMANGNTGFVTIYRPLEVLAATSLGIVGVGGAATFSSSIIGGVKPGTSTTNNTSLSGTSGSLTLGTISANTLRAGSRVRVRAQINSVNNSGSGNITYSFEFGGGSTVGITVTDATVAHTIDLTFDAVVTVIGASGTVYRAVSGVTPVASTAANNNNGWIDTTASRTIALSFVVGGTINQSLTVQMAVVDIYL